MASWTLLLLAASVTAQAIVLPPDPFDATDRYALLLPAADGTLTRIQAKIAPPGPGEVIAQVRYKLPPSGPESPGKPYHFAVSRAIPLPESDSTEPVVMTFDFSDYPVPASAYDRSLAIMYLAPEYVGPLILKEYSGEQLLLRPADAVLETDLRSSQTAASGSTVVGPITLLRERGKPQTETIRFDVTETEGVFFLRLTNGDAEGKKRVTAAVVTLNGYSVFRPSEFNRKVTGMTRQINVRPGENALDVTLRGEPGAQLTLEVVREDGRVCRVLGPLTFDRVTGKPETEEVTFVLAPQVSGPFTLKVFNGEDGKRRRHGHKDRDDHRRHRVDSGVIKLNGVTVINTNDFNEGVTEISRVVTLQPTNTLRVKLNGMPGDWITLEITGFDNVPPQVTITSPVSGSVVTAGPITVTGTVDDPLATVTVNGVIAAVNPDGTFTAEGVPLQEGENTLTVVATDSCGNQGQDSVTVRLNTGPAEPPDLILCAGPYLESPPDPHVITECPTEALVRTRGTVMGETDPSAVSVRIEGVVLPDGVRITEPDPPIDWALREGTFFSSSLWIPEPDGLHTVTASATNAAGQERTATVTFLRDTVPPVLIVTAPPDLTVTNASTVTFTGTVDDPQVDLWLLQPTITQIPVTNGTFALTVTLPTQQGTTTYRFTAWDPARNAASAQVRIIRDTILPTVNITAPLAAAFLPTRTVTVSGTIIDQNPGTATLSVNNGAPIPLTIPPNVQGSVPFSGVGQFNEGANTFGVTAVDKAGNTRTVSRSVTVDTVFPTISMTAPAAGAQLSGTVNVAAQASDVGSGLTGVSLLVDGQVLATDAFAPYSFSLDTLTVPAGARTLAVQAADRAGNTAQASRSVTVQKQLRAQITSPVGGSTVLYSPILVQGTIINNFGPPEIGITVNGYVAEVQGGKFAVDGVAVAAGPNTITATATDAGGVTAMATASVTAIADLPTPSVTLTAEFSSSLAPAPVTFEVETQLENPIALYQIDFDGNGAVDFTNSTFVGVAHTYSVAGLYLPTVFVTDTQGQTFSARTVVNVWDQSAIDTLLQSKWAKMKTALSNNEIDTALEVIAVTAREGYGELFTALSSQLGQIDLMLPGISFVSIAGDRAEYQMIRVDNGVRLSYFVLLLKDTDGIWRLKFF